MLVVDDGSLLTPSLRRSLAEAGFRISTDDQQLIASLRTRRYDAVLINANVLFRRLLGFLEPLTAKLDTKSGFLTVGLVPSIVAANEREVVLTRVEERLLAALLLAPGAVVSRAELIERAWFERVAAHTLSVHMSNLKVKLAKLGVRIEAARGGGYRLASFGVESRVGRMQQRGRKRPK